MSKIPSVHTAGYIKRSLDGATLLVARCDYLRLLADCRGGYVPTIRPEDGKAHVIVRAALTRDGVRVYPASGTDGRIRVLPPEPAVVEA